MVRRLNAFLAVRRVQEADPALVRVAIRGVRDEYSYIRNCDCPDRTRANCPTAGLGQTECAGRRVVGEHVSLARRRITRGRSRPAPVIRASSSKATFVK